MRITDDHYETLKPFFVWASKHLLGVSASLAPDQHPAAVLAHFETVSMAKARTGLAMAIGDIIEMSEGFSARQVAEIDSALDAQGIITLSAVRGRFWTRIRRVLERGSIRGEREYYAVRNVVEALPEEEQGSAWQMLATFEAKAAGKVK